LFPSLVTVYADSPFTAPQLCLIVLEGYLEILFHGICLLWNSFWPRLTKTTKWSIGVPHSHLLLPSCDCILTTTSVHITAQKTCINHKSYSVICIDHIFNIGINLCSELPSQVRKLKKKRFLNSVEILHIMLCILLQFQDHWKWNQFLLLTRWKSYCKVYKEM